MKQTNLQRSERLALRRACDELVTRWRALDAIDAKTAEEFRAPRHALISATKEVLGIEGLLGPEETELLDWASSAPDYLHTLAVRKVIKALDISEARICCTGTC